MRKAASYFAVPSSSVIYECIPRKVLGEESEETEQKKKLQTLGEAASDVDA